MVVVIDSQMAGISGDMLLCALVDLGADRSKILSGIEVAKRHLPGSTIHRLDFTKEKKNGIDVTRLVLKVEEDVGKRRGTEIKRCIEESLLELDMSEKAKGFAIACIDALVGAESKIHGAPAGSVHLHEASSIDTVIDILGCAIALDDLGILDDDIVSTAVAVGGGTVSFSHGESSNPAPAVLEILRDSQIPIHGGPVADELTTPTGACMLVSLATSHREFYPAMEVDSVGYGGGAKSFESFANVLKIVRGKKSLQTDSVVVLETNIDDVSGEVLGGLIERVIGNGAKDVTVSGAITKKNRPTNLVTVICAGDAVDGIVRILADETGTLGIRIRRSERLVRPRQARSEKITINGAEFDVRFKVDPSTQKLLKAEFDDVRKVSEALGLPLREAEDLVRDAIRALGGRDG